MANVIELHQALHGYGDGHQLLSSSLTLTNEQHWQMLVMSDLSGPSFRKGFESYLTGYPLEVGGFYCLARTWFAPELPRLGCVWTHTLLISDTDVARVHDFRSILSHFKRPRSNRDVEGYGAPIYYTPAAHQSNGFGRAISIALLHCLYGSPSRNVVLTSESSLAYEELVIALFSQQWPRLRRSFKFCTGALAIRDAAFDLVVAPPDAVRQDTAGQERITLAGEAGARAITEQAGEDWVRGAAEDLLTADIQGPLRRFLWRFGPDYINGRNAFHPLCEIHLARSRDAESVEQVLSATAHFFPEPDSSRRLKTEFFGLGGHFSGLPHGESLVLHALVTHPAAGSVAEDIAAIRSRATSLAASDAEEAAPTAAEALNVGGALAEQYLDGFAAGVGLQSTVLRSLSQPLTFDALARRPGLVASPELWSGSAERQLAIAARLPSLSNVSVLCSEVTEAVLVAKAWPALASVFAQCGQKAGIALLDWIDSLSDVSLSLPDAFLRALRDHWHLLAQIIRQKPLGPRALRVASTLLDPRAYSVRALGTQVWVGLVGCEIHFASADIEVRSRAFLLTLGLSVSGEGDVQLVREGFAAVYNAALKGDLSDEIWLYLEPYLPWYLATWDRCARLIRGTVRRFLDRWWPASEFLATFVTEEQFQRALEEAEGTWRGSRYIKEMCELTDAGSLRADGLQAAALRRYYR